MTNVFAYGSLLFPEIADGLCQCSLTTKTATLNGFARFAVKGADYPAIIPNRGSKVKGKVLLNLDEEAINLLAFYEGDEYKIAPVKVETDSETINAIAFLWTAGNGCLENIDWDMAQFKSESLVLYRDEVIPATVNEFKRSFL